MIKVISILSLLLGMPLQANGQQHYFGTVDVLGSTTVADLDQLNGVEVRGGKIFVFGPSISETKSAGTIFEYSFTEGKLEKSGYASGIQLKSRTTDGITNPTGITYHETMGTFIGNSHTNSQQIYFLDWDILKNSRNLDWASLNVVNDDLAAYTAIPEFVYYKGEWLLATADSGPFHTVVRLYDAFSLQRARSTSEEGVLRYSFIAPPHVTHMHWHNASGELLLSQQTHFGGWKLISIDLNQSIQSEIAQENSIVVLPNRMDYLRGFHRLYGANEAIVVSSSRQGNLNAIRLENINKGE